MGDPKKQRKKYETPRNPFARQALDSELKLLGEYGLRNKREIWRHHFFLTKYRTLARELLGTAQEERVKVEEPLLRKLFALKIVPENATLDNVLDLKIGDVLERRLQTIVLRHGLSKTAKQARQLITHGHISIKGREVTSPSYVVSADEELSVEYAPTSPFQRVDHPLKREMSTPASS